MKRLCLSIITVLLLVILASCGNQKSDANPPACYYDVLKVKADLAASSMNSMYDPSAFDQLEEDILAGKVSSTDCYYRIAKILSTYHVAHVYLTRNEPDPFVLPFDFYNFGKEEIL